LLLTPEKNGKNIFLVIISWKKNILLNPYLLQQTIASAYNSQQKSYPLCKCSFIYTFDNCAGFYVKSLKITISTYRYSRALKWCLLNGSTGNRSVILTPWEYLDIRFGIRTFLGVVIRIWNIRRVVITFLEN
jgi:hypothetical protein